VIVLDTLLIGGLKFVLGKIAAAVEAEMDDDSRLREELLAAQMRLELGEITDAEYVEIEKVLLARINEIRAQRTGGPMPPGTFKITGVEATFGGDEAGESAEEPSRPPGRRRR
jgi:Gas vesicle protein G